MNHSLNHSVTPAAVASLNVSINGASHSIAPGSIADLIAARGLQGKRLAVERNGEIVPRSAHATTSLRDGDRLEIVIAVGGG